MRITKLLAAAGLAATLAVLGGCAAPSGPVIAPVTREVGSLQGATVELVVGQALNIDTGDVAVDSYTGQVDDPAVAEFVPGREEDDAVYNPGVMARAAGTTTVVLSSSDAGIEDVTFTVEVSGAQQGGY
ncbi:hypothetical protein [Microbacterium sulfonylureivorans]|uniref:hypothetical protein n=1 Tax=Microbacterium sulfonylureivorans TaxID=2486854 RepID=UPI000FDC6AAF|nr:hypothetical protein [Microbacterium sulfonylureivorans]